MPGKATRRLEMDMGEWRPIETAPKDGRDILVCAVCQTTGEVLWGVATADPDRLWLWWKPQDEPAKWPTHWQPLPDPPADT